MARVVQRWNVLVPVVALFTGLLVVTTARTAAGTNLRSQQTDVADLVRSAAVKVTSENNRLKLLQQQVATRTSAIAQSDAGVSKITRSYQDQLQPGGLTAVSGPGLQVTLDDAHPSQVDPSIDPNDLVVHQSDMQAVVNALWAGGAEAMSLMGQRLIATSAVRCVGNTLLLNGQLFSPPFKVAAIGPATQMKQRLDASPNVTLYRQASRAYGLQYDVAAVTQLAIAAYDSPVGLTYAKIGG